MGSPRPKGACHSTLAVSAGPFLQRRTRQKVANRPRDRVAYGEAFCACALPFEVCNRAHCLLLGFLVSLVHFVPDRALPSITDLSVAAKTEVEGLLGGSRACCNAEVVLGHGHRHLSVLFPELRCYGSVSLREVVPA